MATQQPDSPVTNPVFLDPALTGELGAPSAPRKINVSGTEAWLMSRMDDLKACFAHPGLVGPTAFLTSQGRSTPFSGLFENTMLGTEGAEHTRLRRLFSKAFTGRRIESLRPRVQEITDDLLDRIAPDGRADLVTDLAFPLPMRVICELLGVPFADRDQFGQWGETLMAPAGGLGTDARSEEAAASLWRYIERLADIKRRDPADDLLSALISAHDEDRLTADEVVITGRFMLISGYESTATFLGAAMAALLSHPEQLATLRKNPELVKSATEELLRYNGPGHFNLRYAAEDLEIGDIRIKRGEQVVLDLEAASCDPQWTDDACLDVTRENAQHLRFGHGIHHCLGAPLARLEGQTVFDTIVRRFPDIALAVEPDELRHDERKPLRPLEALPVTFSPAP